MMSFLSDIQPEESLNKVKQTKQAHVRGDRTRRAKQGGYRPVLVDVSCLKEESIELEKRFKLLSELNMNEQDMCSFYILNYLSKRYPNKLFENKMPIVCDQKEIDSVRSLSYVDLCDFSGHESVRARLQKSHHLKTLFDLVNTFNLHCVPYSARFVLVSWYLNRVRLNLFVNKIPTSFDVLRMQSRGERCISLIYENIDKLVMNERDALSFLLHDLVHAYKMFSDAYLMRGQVGFSRAMLRLFDDPSAFAQLNELIQNDQAFSDQLDYLISDMNSHPKHLMHYFKAILINSFKKRFQMGNDDDDESHLSGEPLQKFDQLFELFLSLFEMNENEKRVCRSMLAENNCNPSLVGRFNLVDFTLLDGFFLKLASQINI